jgi:hypothetical protein
MNPHRPGAPYVGVPASAGTDVANSLLCAAARLKAVHQPARSGAALVEGAIVLTMFLTIIFALFDLGLAVMRENTLAEAARRLAREASLRGEKAAVDRTLWGPTPRLETADAATELASTARSKLLTVDPADVQIEVSWPDGRNRSGDRVTVVLTYQHHTTLPFLFGSQPLELRGESTMRIER